MGFIEIKGLNDRLEVISILAKNEYLVRLRKIELQANGKKASVTGIEYEKPEDPYTSVSRRDDE